MQETVGDGRAETAEAVQDLCPLGVWFSHVNKDSCFEYKTQVEEATEVLTGWVSLGEKNELEHVSAWHV